jgi:hypothetical protein
MMAKMTVGFGVLLLAVSLGFWFAMGHATAALHPAGLGLFIAICGALAITENPKRRMLWMHIAVTLGLIGFLITGINAVLEVIKGTSGVDPLAFDERVVAALICLVFVGLCVRSFIAARRTRLA